MTTKHSPLNVLKAQADKIAATIKAAERGDAGIDAHFEVRLAAARLKGMFKVGIAMDDKLITVELPWETIRSSSEVGLSAYILKLMREERDQA